MTIQPAHHLREQFLLDPQVIYLNHGSFGATPRHVFESYQRWQREIENQPTLLLGRRATELMEHSRQDLAAFLGTSSRNLAYVMNTTTGINIIARSLSLSRGDEVLATDHEYGALDRTWQYLAQKNGFRYINQAIPLPVTTSGAFVDAFWAGVTPRTRVIFISHITSPTALIFPVEEICRRARQSGIITVVDGAHAPGQIPLSLDALGADFYSGNLHKWLCAPKGSAFLYARSDAIPMLEPLIVSWGYQSEAPGPSKLVDYVEWQGTRDISPFLAVPDAIRFYQDNHFDLLRDGCHELLVKTVSDIAAISHKAPVSPLTWEWFSQMDVAPLPDSVDVTALHDQLYEDFHIEIPIFDWHGQKFARCSFQVYNTPADAEALITALDRLL
jgi:isopenicillin-N epimerase